MIKEKRESAYRVPPVSLSPAELSALKEVIVARPGLTVSGVIRTLIQEEAERVACNYGLDTLNEEAI